MRNIKFMLLITILSSGCIQASARNASIASPSRENMDNIIVISKDAMLNEISRQNLSKTNDTSITDQAEQLIQQNYKTPIMKYNILLLMNNNNFMVVNKQTASIENFPTINEILGQSYNNNNIDKKIIVDALQTSLQAINGALADDAYNNQSIFYSGIKNELNVKKEMINTRLKQIDPVSYLKLYMGVGALGIIAATAGAYYYGITPKTAQDYIVSAGQDVTTTITKSANSLMNSLYQQISSGINSGMSSASAGINSTYNMYAPHFMRSIPVTTSKK